jgi:predicted DNA-binding protein (MmcQ/YjbR family)
MTADDFRALALDLPGAVEQSHMGHPDFRANGRIFATLHADDEWGMVKVYPAEQQALMADYPDVFVPAAGAWGRQGCTNVCLKKAKVATVRAALMLAWELVNSQKPPRARTARKPSSRNRR